MFNKLKNLFAPKPAVAQKQKKTRVSKPKEDLEAKARQAAKEAATAKDEPWVSIISVDIDPENINSGAFELDWNAAFLRKLIRAGYHQNENDTDDVVIDRWFQSVCRNVALEVYEQKIADPANRSDDDIRPPLNRKPLGGGRSEIS
jgi:hypothetical protein